MAFGSLLRFSSAEFGLLELIEPLSCASGSATAQSWGAVLEERGSSTILVGAIRNGTGLRCGAIVLSESGRPAVDIMPLSSTPPGSSAEEASGSFCCARLALRAADRAAAGVRPARSVFGVASRPLNFGVASPFSAVTAPEPLFGADFGIAPLAVAARPDGLAKPTVRGPA